MIVYELIEELQKLDKHDKRVFIYHEGETIAISRVFIDGDGEVGITREL